MNQYVLLLHERPMTYADVSAAEMQETIERYRAWAEELGRQGLMAGGEKLADDGGRHLRLKDGKPLATDGPYAEAHDVIGGYFVIKAEDDAHAERIAATCPHLAGTQWIEIRRVDPM